jgi:O-antigen/teichoic acid export membrane protein
MSIGPRRLLNFSSNNVRLIVNIIVGIIGTRLIISKLGVDTYGNVAFVLSLGSLVTIFGNAIVGAAARYATMAYAQKKSVLLNVYVNNVLAVTVLLGIGSCLCVVLLSSTSQTLTRGLPCGFLLFMITSISFVTVGSVLGVGNFVRERFISKNAVEAVGRLSYLFVLFVILYRTNAGVWAIAVASLIAGIIRFAGLRYLLHLCLPSIRFSTGCIRREKLFEIFAFTGWMFLAYCGIYLIRTGLMFVVKKYMSPQVLGEYALVIFVSVTLQNVLTSVGVMTGPQTYRSLAVGDRLGATKQIKHFVLVVSLIWVAAFLALMYEGQNLLIMWLGDALEPNLNHMLLLGLCSAYLGSLSVPISVYLAGCSCVKGYGIITLCEGVLVCVLAAASMTIHRESIIWVVLLPGISAAIKNLIVVPLVYRKDFEWDFSQNSVRCMMLLVLYVAVSIALWNIAHRWFKDASFVDVSIRISSLLTPLAGLGVFRALLSYSKPLETVGKTTHITPRLDN